MFSGAESYNGDVGSWDTSKVENMEYTFKDAKSFNRDISKLNLIFDHGIYVQRCEEF
jgi:surface protein